MSYADPHWECTAQIRALKLALAETQRVLETRTRERDTALEMSEDWREEYEMAEAMIRHLQTEAGRG